jgi:predicted ATPase/DNA-binding XRE family transcriptional regulator
MHPLSSFGHWLRLKRKGLDLTRQELADQVGCSVATIRKLEAEERRPSAQIVERLADIFEIPPDERRAFLRFARGDWQSAPADQLPGRPWQVETVETSPRHFLPASTTSFIGRQAELTQLQEYLRHPDIRLITLIGPPGIGKTRLSLEAAWSATPDFPDGVVFIPLAQLTDPSLVASAILQGLSLVEILTRNPTKQLADAIRDKRLLLILDNCEHLIDSVALLAYDLLVASPQLNIVTTSRESLRVPGEWLFFLPPLATPEAEALITVEAVAEYPAIRLFAERARAVRADFALDSTNIQAVATLCAQLGGLPLAIELIASRMRVMSPQALLLKLTDQFMLSADGMRAVPARQKTLFNAISWSYDFLPPDEQKMFACLAVFAGEFTFAAAETVLGETFTGRSVTDLITALLDKSLVQRTLDIAGEIRFTILVPIRQYALTVLPLKADESRLRNEHLDYFLNLAERGSMYLRGPSQIEWGDRLESEYGNFRAALDWSVTSRQTELALRLLCALGWPWEVRGHYREARLWLEKIRSLPDVDQFPLLLSRVLNHIGRHSWTQDNPEDARALLAESRDIALECGPAGELSLAESLNWLGLVVLRSDGKPEQARAIFDESLSLNQRWDDEWAAALSTFHLGIAESDLGHETEAFSLFEDSLRSFRRHGDLFFIARVSLFLGYAHLFQERFEQARAYFEDHLRIDSELQFWDGIAEGWRDLGNLFRWTGEFAEAGQCFAESMAVCQRHNLVKPELLLISGVIAVQRQDYSTARQWFRDYWQQIKAYIDSSTSGYLLTGLAAVAAGTHDPEQAARLSGAVENIRPLSDLSLSPLEKIEINRLRQVARHELGQEQFEVLQAEGQAMSLEQALTYALASDQRL